MSFPSSPFQTFRPLGTRTFVSRRRLHETLFGLDDVTEVFTKTPKTCVSVPIDVLSFLSFWSLFISGTFRKMCVSPWRGRSLKCWVTSTQGRFHPWSSKSQVSVQEDCRNLLNFPISLVRLVRMKTKRLRNKQFLVFFSLRSDPSILSPTGPVLRSRFDDHFMVRTYQRRTKWCFTYISRRHINKQIMTIEPKSIPVCV